MAYANLRPNEYYIDKVLKKKRVGGRQQYFVSWTGFPSSHNAWVKRADLRKVKVTSNTDVKNETPPPRLTRADIPVLTRHGLDMPVLKRQRQAPVSPPPKLRPPSPMEPPTPLGSPAPIELPMLASSTYELIGHSQSTDVQSVQGITDSDVNDKQNMETETIPLIESYCSLSLGMDVDVKPDLELLPKFWDVCHTVEDLDDNMEIGEVFKLEEFSDDDDDKESGHCLDNACDCH